MVRAGRTSKPVVRLHDAATARTAVEGAQHSALVVVGEVHVLGVAGNILERDAAERVPRRADRSPLRLRVAVTCEFTL